MKATAVLTTILSAPSLASGDAAIEYLEPNVQRIEGLLPASICNELIAAGEKAGFLVKEESIDQNEQEDALYDKTKKYVPSQTIDVYELEHAEFDDEKDEEEIGNAEIWETLQPWLPKIKQIVKDNRNKEGFAKFYPNEPDREPILDWIFFRKYSPSDERNSLQHHHDTNMNTVNIELSNDYTGGGLFYIKPLASTGEIDSRWKDAGYELVDTIKRGNTTEILFPDLHAGDAIFYNYTVEHGVAPCESGTRYSMAFFFDMDNPEVEADFDDSRDSGDGEEDEEAFDVKLKNQLETEVDIVLVLKMREEEIWKRVLDNVRVNETVVNNAYEGDLIKVLKAGTDEVLQEYELKREHSSIKMSLNDSLGIRSEL